MDFIIYAGTSFFPNDAAIVNRPVNLSIHENFFIDRGNDDLNDIRNDIALVKLSRPMIVSEQVKIILMTNISHHPEERFVVPIFEIINESLFRLRIIQQVAIHPDACHMNTFNSSTQICTKGINAPCDGDSGSGLVKLDNGRSLLAGLLSFGLVCEETSARNKQESRDIFVDVMAYRSWIETKITLLLNS